MDKLLAEDLAIDIEFEKDFNSTLDLEFGQKLIGQKRGLEALEFGLSIKDDGYNIYVAGDMGTGKTTSAKLLCSKISKTEKIPPDFIFVHNFKSPKEPILIEVPPSVGTELKNDLEEVITMLLEELSKVLEDKNLDNKKNELLKGFQEEREELIKILSEEIEDENFGVKSSASGIYLMPIKNGEIITEEEFDALSDEEKDYFTANSLSVNLKAEAILEEIKNKEKVLANRLDELDYSAMIFVVGRYFTRLINKYNYVENEKLTKYLFEMKEDILENIDDFLPDNAVPDDEMAKLLQYQKPNDDKYLDKYKINVFVDNSKEKNAKVVVVENPTYTNLFGEVECESEANSLTTSFLKIKSGAFHEAYGGYIIINSYDLLTNVGCYEAIRRTLKTKKISIDAQREINTGTSFSIIKPEDMEFNAKIILIGSFSNYYNISNFDDDFRKYFKVLASFDEEIDLNKKNVSEIANFVRNFIEKNNSKHFTKEAIISLIRFSILQTGNRKTLDTNFNLLCEILTEALVFSNINGEKMVSNNSIEKAIKSRKNRLSSYEEKMEKLIDDKIIMIETDGEAVGQINGLCVISTVDYSFGIPTKITATTYIGKEGFVNIEKEAELSGSIHEKGVGVLTGYLGEKYSQDFPLCVSSRVCFEQNYSGVDGDSASSTELYAILSSLAEVPIKQSIAVTGSVNQKGLIQPIGGATEKVEGFFKLCKKRGLTGKEGVIIPSKNVSDLILSDEIINAVGENLFNIYAVDTIDEAMEILTDKKMGKMINGVYEEDTINYLVYEKLKRYYIKSREKVKND